jgi:CRISPR/Cas system CSM-associated protein Csm3 (group 7 of RAMP superfamily)
MTITAGRSEVTGGDQPQQVCSVTFIRFYLAFAEPGAVTVPGHPGRDDDAPWGRERAHLLADTDPLGRPHLPGTSLAGALREMVRLEDGRDIADQMFGQLLPVGSGGAEVDARASQIWVLGCRPAELGAVMSGQVRASTAISRQRGAAEPNTLRVEEVLAPGSRFEVFLRWDDADPGGLERFLGLLAAWRPLIGHGVSRGRGRCVTENVRYGELRLDDPAGVLRWLTLSGPDLAREVAVTDVTAPADAGEPDELIRVGVRIIGPLRVGSGEPPEATGSQGQKVTPMFRDGDRYLLPGSGLKGLLRSRAEFILRSVGMVPAPCLDQRCGRCWTCHVFGHAGGHDETARAVGARAIIRVPDAVVECPVAIQRQHVGIDRFTGGAHDGLLYTVDALESGTFVITVERLAAELAQDAVGEIRAVLRLVFDDLNDGLAGIGAGVARGYGTVTLDLAAAQDRGELPDGPSARRELARMVAGSARAEAG